MTDPWHIVVVLAGSARLIVTRLHKDLIGEPPKDWPENGFAVEGLEIYLPLREGRSCRRGIVRKWKTPLFGRYMFARLDVTADGADNRWPVLKKQRGVVELLHVTGGLAEVSEADIARVRAQENSKGVIPFAVARTLFKVGDQVRVTDGPFQSFGGPVEELETRVKKRTDYRGKDIAERVAVAKVRVSIFGRETLTEIEEKDLEPV